MPDRKQLIERLRAMADRAVDWRDSTLPEHLYLLFAETADTLERDAAVLDAAEQFFAHEWPAESSKQRRENLVEYAVDHPALRLFDALAHAKEQGRADA